MNIMSTLPFLKMFLVIYGAVVRKNGTISAVLGLTELSQPLVVHCSSVICHCCVAWAPGDRLRALSLSDCALSGSFTCNICVPMYNVNYRKTTVITLKPCNTHTLTT